MEYEYVAVPLIGGGELWREYHFTYWQECLLSDGWEEFVRAPWKPIAPGDTGGTCVFRRKIPSDKKLKEAIMEYEYVALSWNKEYDATFAKRKTDLISQGWQVYAQACWQDTYTGACIMRRPKDSCKPECCAEEKETCIEKTLLVLPIYNVYLKKTCYDSEQALRLTFIEVQRREGHALTWPHR